MENFTSPFLGTEGRTATSANHLCNLAKEYYQHLEKMLTNQSLVTKTVSIVGQGNPNILISGITDLSPMQKALKEIAQCKALIAYFREGIKAKENLEKQVKDYGSEKPQFTESFPEREAYLTEADIMATWPLEKRVRYYALEAKAATYGQYIHPNQAFAEQRATFHKALVGESTIKERENYVLIYENKPTLTLDEVESTFFNMQNTHREAEAELNSLKQEIKDALTADKLQKDNAYAVAYQKYIAANEAYHDNLKAIALADANKRTELSKTVSKFKILIPENLKDMIKKLENL